MRVTFSHQIWYRPKWLTIALLGCCLGGDASFAASDEHGLHFSLHAEKQSYLIAEPIVLRFSLTSSARFSANIDDSFSVGHGVTLQYRSANEPEFQPWAPAFTSDVWAYRKIPFPAGGLSAERLFVFDVNRKYVRPSSQATPSVHAITSRAGKYYFKATYRASSNKGDILRESQAIEIEVVEPQGDDKKALSLWMDNQVLYAVDDPGGLPEDVTAGYEKIKKLVATYPQSHYAHFARRAMTRIEAKDKPIEGHVAVSSPPNTPATTETNIETRSPDKKEATTDKKEAIRSYTIAALLVATSAVIVLMVFLQKK
jgi:hypothetical protein